MTSPFQRSHERGTHLQLVSGGEANKTPHLAEGFLITSHTEKADAIIDFTLRGVAAEVSKRNVIIVPGFSGIKPVYGSFRDAVAEALESNTSSFRHPRTEKGLLGLTIDKTLHPDKLGKQSVVAMIDMMRQRYPENKVTLIGHSMGGPNAVEGALRRLDDVEDVVLLGSGGLEKGQNVIRLGRRMADIGRQEGKSVLRLPREHAISMLGQAAFHILRNPWRTAGEALDVGNRDLMVDELAMLRGHDIGVHAVQMERDGFFPTDIALRDAEPHVDTISVIEDLDHLGPQLRPGIVANHIAMVLAEQAFAIEAV